MAKPKSANQRILVKIYREFSRIKYEKYKRQFPRVRESELVAKILKEWEAMGETEKMRLGEQYTARLGSSFLDPTSSSDSQKKNVRKQQPEEDLSDEAKKQKTKPIKKKKKISPKVRVFRERAAPSALNKIQEDYEKMSQRSKKGGSGDTPDKQKVQNSSSNSANIVIKPETSSGRHTKLSSKNASAKRSQRGEQYLNFYKYYYERLRGEHPRWSTSQVNTIIKLLWKKKGAAGQKKKEPATRAKALSGRQLFSRTKSAEGYLKEQIRQLWKQLPHQSKKYWQIRGQGTPRRSKKNSGKLIRKVLSSGVTKEHFIESETTTGYDWMNQPIRK